MTAKKQLNARIAVPLQQAVAEKAKERGETVTHVIETAFQAYIQDGPAEPPGTPVAVPEGKDAPTGRAESPEPRTDPELASERKRRAPTRRAKAASPEPDAPSESTAEPASEGARITTEIDADPDEVARLRRSRQQAREGHVRWDDEPDSLGAARAVAERIGAPLKAAADLTPHPAAALVLREPGGEATVGPMPPAPAAKRKRCTHPGTRSIGGFCKECDHMIERGGYWREP
jgi:hypothetical protein